MLHTSSPTARKISFVSIACRLNFTSGWSSAPSSAILPGHVKRCPARSASSAQPAPQKHAPQFCGHLTTPGDSGGGTGLHASSGGSTARKHEQRRHSLQSGTDDSDCRKESGRSEKSSEPGSSGRLETRWRPREGESARRKGGVGGGAKADIGGGVMGGGGGDG
jgi:hypothetical protein